MADTRNMERYMQGYSNDQGASDYGDASGNGAVSADDPSADYQGPDQGPFECSNCQFFVADGQPCQKVSDPVQSQGCCNLFLSAGNGNGDSSDQDNSQSFVPSPAKKPGMALTKPGRL